MARTTTKSRAKRPWNAGKSVGPKKPLDADTLNSLRRILKAKGKVRDLALLETAISTMLRGSDVLRLGVNDVRDSNGEIVSTFTFRMKKTGKGVTVTLSDAARDALGVLIEDQGKRGSDYLFTARNDTHGEPITTTSFRRSIKSWCELVHLDPAAFSTHSLRRTNATWLYKRTGNLRAVQLLLGHSNISMTQRYLGVDMDDAILLAQRNQI